MPTFETITFPRRRIAGINAALKLNTKVQQIGFKTWKSRVSEKQTLIKVSKWNDNSNKICIKATASLRFHISILTAPNCTCKAIVKATTPEIITFVVIVISFISRINKFSSSHKSSRHNRVLVHRLPHMFLHFYTHLINFDTFLAAL